MDVQGLLNGAKLLTNVMKDGSAGQAFCQKRPKAPAKNSKATNPWVGGLKCADQPLRMCFIQ